jgi:hypothetical protein
MGLNCTFGGALGYAAAVRPGRPQRIPGVRRSSFSPSVIATA